MAYKLAERLHNLYYLGCSQRFRAGDEISSCPDVGTVATQPLPPKGFPNDLREENDI